MNLRGLLIDLDGVLYIEDQLIPGAPDSVNWLRSQGYPFRFLTNTTMKSRDELVQKLNRFGITAKSEEIFSTSVVAARWLARHEITRVQLLLPENSQEDFKELEITDEQPDAVVVGDLGRDFSYDILNTAFLALRKGARLIALQKNRFWRTEKGPALDVGPWVAALEYAAETEATVVGKPNPSYFEAALDDMGLPASQVAMIGDDIHSDIVGAQAVGARTILVKTGKYELDAEKKLKAQPDWILDSIADLPELLMLDA
jgi:HAD superfamily hydrolase (TIGR01458 family)